MNDRLIRLSKFLSLVLRHKPEEIGLKLDSAGWVDVDQLLSCLTAHNRSITRDELNRVVAENNKQRFAFSEDGRRIRASQGHSITVTLGLESREPPPVLYHGTATRFINSIRATGLEPRGRQHVHLSADRDTATAVGRRHGTPVVLVVEAQRMHAAALEFFLSDNNVWLTAFVDPSYIIFPP